MVITNPTDSMVSITLEGVSYSVQPNDSVVVPATVGKKWKLIHAFLMVSDEEPQQIVEEEVEEIVMDTTDMDVTDNVQEETDRVNEVKESQEAPVAPTRGKGLIERLKAAAKGKK